MSNTKTFGCEKEHVENMMVTCNTMAGTHLTFLRTIDGDLGYVWARAGQLGSIPKEWTHLP